MSKPMFLVTIRVTADQMSELMINWAPQVKGFEVEPNGIIPEGGSRAVRPHHKMRKRVPLILTDKSTAVKGGRSLVIALQATKKFGAGRSQIDRADLDKVVGEAMVQAGLSHSSNSPAISVLIKQGFLKEKRPELQ